jgi:carbon storage regulator
MLVLSRKVDEMILIGEEIVITVLEIDGTRVKLGITAPRSIDIVRQEVVQEERRPTAEPE